MNRRAKSLLIAVIGLLIAPLLVGCGARLVPFTHEIRTQYNLTDDEVKNLQYYVSHAVTLRRELDSSDRQITGSHRLVLTTGKVIEEVIVEKKTPGIAVSVRPDTLVVSFDIGSQLEFALRTGTPVQPQPLRKSRFAEPPEPFPGDGKLLPEPPESDDSLMGKYWLVMEPAGTLVTYQGRVFEALEETHRAHLLIDAEQLEEEVENSTTLPGRTL